MIKEPADIGMLGVISAIAATVAEPRGKSQRGRGPGSFGIRKYRRIRKAKNKLAAKGRKAARRGK